MTPLPHGTPAPLSLPWEGEGKARGWAQPCVWCGASTRGLLGLGRSPCGVCSLPALSKTVFLSLNLSVLCVSS